MNKKILGLNFGLGRQVPMILQSEAAECGLACLGMIVGYYGHQIDLMSLRARFSLSLRGMTLAHLVEISCALKLTSRAIKLEDHEMKYAGLPCILHWNLNHFVVLKGINYKPNGSIKSYVINDPARGELNVSPIEFSGSFTGIVLELMPTPEFETKKEKQQQFSFVSLLSSAVGLKRSLLQIFLLALALEIFSLVSPFFMQLVVDGAVLSSNSEMVFALVFGFSLLMLMQQAISAFRSWALLYMSTHLNLQWVTNVFTHLLNLPLGYFEKRHLGDVISRFGAVNNIEQALSTKLVETLLDGIFAVSILVMLMFYSASLSYIVIGFIILYLLLRWVSYESFRKANEHQIFLQAQENNIFLESINSIQSIKLYNHETARCTRWTNALVASINRKLSTQKMKLGFNAIEQILKGTENLFVVGIGALMVIDQKFSLGMLFAFLTYKTMLVGRAYSFAESFFELKMLSLQNERLADIVMTKREDHIDNSDMSRLGDSKISYDRGFHGSTSQPVKSFTIELRDVSFRYSDLEPWVIKNVSLTIRPGESVAIVGASGCGKTTLLKLLIGILQPTTGMISVGDISLNQLGHHAFRELIGVVMQDDRLLTGSIAENISFFDEKFDVEWMHKCAVDASISDDIDAMPMRYETLISGMGGSLSGGQKQRILLARALYKRPQILFLDEATSHLDLASELSVNTSISQLSLTRIIVAHRPETIRSAQRIITIAHGKIESDVQNTNEQTTN